MKMLDLLSIDINKIFIVINKKNLNDNMILEYIGIDGFGENSHLTHKFRYSYHSNMHINSVYYPISCQECYMLQSITLPFDITTIINAFLYTKG